VYNRASRLSFNNFSRRVGRMGTSPPALADPSMDPPKWIHEIQDLDLLPGPLSDPEGEYHLLLVNFAKGHLPNPAPQPNIRAPNVDLPPPNDFRNILGLVVDDDDSSSEF